VSGIVGVEPTAAPADPTAAPPAPGLREAAQAFEGLFLQALVRRMRDAQLDEGFFGSGAGSAVYEAMFADYLGQQMALRSPLGIASLLEAQAAERSFSPEQARVSRSYGLGVDPIDGSRRFHHGVDLAAPEGTPVLAVAAARVLSVGDRGGYGLEIQLGHPQGWTTRYAHLSRADVEPGQWVVRGQRLGAVGSTGRATGPHLHFEALHDGRAADPAIAAPGPLGPQVLGHATDEYREVREEMRHGD
jgi:murein DD-endopeptidase MepM/ murein hydrolase activator NlpD